MKAAYINETGPPENIICGELPAPRPAGPQCLIRVSAVAVNPIDTYVRGGMVPMKLTFPFVIGCDLAGSVVATGPEVKRFKPGDRVWGSNQGLLGRQGTFSEFAAVDEAWLYPTPGGVNVWWETLREPDFDRTMKRLAPRGRMVLMAGREARPVFPVGLFYVKGCSLHGFAMFNATPEEQRAAAEAINRWLVEGKLKPNIDRILPLSEAAAAHRLQEESTLRKSGALSGKIVLRL